MIREIKFVRMVATREERKAEREKSKPLIKDATKMKMADKTTFKPDAFKIKTNRNIFTPSKARDHFILSPEGSNNTLLDLYLHPRDT